MIGPFRDRAEAGQLLAELMNHRALERDAVVLALPRGGVPVGFEVAMALNAPLDVMVVRKLGVPGQEELAMGAIASGGVRVLNEELIAALRVSTASVEEVTRRERQELERRESVYRQGQPAVEVKGRWVVLTDDGLATGATMLAAARSLRLLGAARLVVAVPVGARETCDRLQSEIDELVCAAMPASLRAVGAWYDDFSQTSDYEVRELLAEAARRVGGNEAERAIWTHQKGLHMHPTQ